jgi:glycosyltransferase involved in cell wall biosynthesis
MTSVGILIPALDEEAFIEGCLRSVQAFELPDGVTIEITVLDGGSRDRTRSIVETLSETDSRIALANNPGRIQSTALNIGILRTHAEYVMRLDAHSAYPPDYLRLCFETSQRTGAANVGGIFVTRARGSGYPARLVQALTTHPFGIGDSTFRGLPPEGPADTVPYGFFRREIFDEIGLFDERLVRAQDYEINRRITKAGGVVWLNPRIEVLYYQQPNLASFLKKQIKKEAPYNAYLWYVAPYAFAPRHAITGIFALGVIGGLVFSLFSMIGRYSFLAVMTLYFLLAIGSAAQQAARYREPRHMLFLPPSFFAFHFVHGCGVLWGLLLLLLRRAPVQGGKKRWEFADRIGVPPLQGQLRDMLRPPSPKQ